MTQLNVTRRQSVQLETANQLLHKRNEVLVVEKQDGEINPALYFDSDNERLALLAKQVLFSFQYVLGMAESSVNCVC